MFAKARWPASLSVDELVELYLVEQTWDPSGVGYWDELVWEWAAQAGQGETAAAGKLAAALEQKLGALPAGFRQRLALALQGLPPAGRAVYQPPAYVISGPAYRVLPILVPGKAAFGIVEKDAIGQISIFANGQFP